MRDKDFPYLLLIPVQTFMTVDTEIILNKAPER